MKLHQVHNAVGVQEGQPAGDIQRDALAQPWLRPAAQGWQPATAHG